MRCAWLRRVGTLPLLMLLAALWGTERARSEPAPPDPTADAPANVTSFPGNQASPADVGVTVAARTPAQPATPVAPAAPPLVGDPARGGSKAAVCGGCHGLDGNAPVAQFPKLAGQRSDYIAKQLRDFKAGRRKDPLMSGMAAMLSDQDIADVAAHFETAKVSVGEGDPELGAAGERIYRKGRPEIGLLPCIGCHGMYGEGANGAIDGGFPAVGGQNPDYLQKQLHGYRSGKRANDWKGIMQLIASRISDEDMAAVIAYLTSLTRSSE